MINSTGVTGRLMGINSRLPSVDSRLTELSTPRSSRFCRCGHTGPDGPQDFEWVWYTEDLDNSRAAVDDDGVEILFHRTLSNGTAAVRGTKLLEEGQHYWEVMLTESVYGTDMMVGVGSCNIDLHEFSTRFVHFLGRTKESWGLSYQGYIYHDGVPVSVCNRFGVGTVIGVHLDMWHGRLTFYKDGEKVGKPFTTGLRGKKLYPFVSSTALKTGMKLIRSTSFSSSLLFMCCEKIRQLVPPQQHAVCAVCSPEIFLPPGTRLSLLNNLYWLMRPYRDQHPEEDSSSVRRL